MKPFMAGLWGGLCMLGSLSLIAQEVNPNLAQFFQHGNTSIRYHLASEALPSQAIRVNADAFVIVTPRALNSIDIYFDDIPDFLFKNTGSDNPQLIEIAFEPEPLRDSYGTVSVFTTSSNSKPLSVPWETGNLAFNSDAHPTIFPWGEPLLGNGGFDRFVKRALVLPLGNSDFSLEALFTMQASPAWRIISAATSSAPWGSARLVSASTSSTTADPLGYAAESVITTPDTGVSRIERTSAPVVIVGTRNSISGAFQVSGTISAAQVFTEVGFASGVEQYRECEVHDEIFTTNIYAMGGANYTIGQVTLGIEAGFENSEDTVNSYSDDLGFEDDFLIEPLLDSDGIATRISNENVYARFSAKLNPAKRLTVEGGVKYTQPLSESIELYGFEVNGTLYYALMDSLRYFAVAEIGSLDTSFDERQYRVKQILEVIY